MKDFPKQEYLSRRENLFKLLEINSLALILGQQTIYRNNDASFPFRQNSDFYYLTGFNEPNAALVLLKTPHEQKTIFFNESNEALNLIWEGAKLGQEKAITDLGMNEAYDITTLEDWLLEHLFFNNYFYYSFKDSKMDSYILGLIQKENLKGHRLGFIPNIVPLLPLIHELRIIKTPYEINLMREAVTISTKAHIKLMQSCKPSLMEYELEAEFAYQSHKRGGRALAYTTIVGGGENACILHYIHNNEALKSGDLVLIDAGCEYELYASDITRTIPVDGKFTQEQKIIYNIVLKAQEAAIQIIKPGIQWNKIQDTILKVMVKELVSQNLIKGQVDEIIAKKSYLSFYMHGSGHWLGLDVHDCGSYQIEGKSRSLEPGMVLTIEPGIYINQNNTDFDLKFRGIGIRIEDDILVTKQGYEILSADLPKRINEIEHIMQSHL
ncbi:MAG: pepP [Francisellaceae bacterium]|nr:pepP [Francisellaceae bacterium]